MTSSILKSMNICELKKFATDIIDDGNHDDDDWFSFSSTIDINIYEGKSGFNAIAYPVVDGKIDTHVGRRII